MSETEAMDISPSGSILGDSGIPGIDVGSASREPKQNEEHGDTASSIQAPSDAHMEGTDSLSKPGIRVRDDVPGDADPNERPLKRARTLDTEVCTSHENQTLFLLSKTSSRPLLMNRVPMPI